MESTKNSSNHEIENWAKISSKITKMKNIAAQDRRRFSPNTIKSLQGVETTQTYSRLLEDRGDLSLLSSLL
jgi:hypothetical protein